MGDQLPSATTLAVSPSSPPPSSSSSSLPSSASSTSSSSSFRTGTIPPEDDSAHHPPVTKLTLPQKIDLCAIINKLLLQQDLQPYALGWGQYGLSLQNPLRRLAITVAHHELFETVSLMIILGNCVMLAIYDPLDFYNTGPRNTAIADSEDFFQALFTIEMVIKLIAFGIYGKGNRNKAVGYLADAWNWLDGLIVVVGFLNYIPNVGSNAASLRTFRVLRPLKSLSAVPSMRVVVSSMLTALPALGNVVLLAVFTLVVFGIIGVQLWSGLLRGRCAYENPLNSGEYVPIDSLYCALPCDQQEGAECTPTVNGDLCPIVPVRYDIPWFDPTVNNTVYNTTISNLPTTCLSFTNPYLGLVNFDDIGHAMLTIFTGMTLEGWTDTMYATQHSWGLKWLVAIYWIVIVAFGAFFLLQLALAVIWESYQSSQTSEEEKADILLFEHGDLLVEYLHKKRKIPWKVRFQYLFGWATCRRSKDIFHTAIHTVPTDHPHPPHQNYHTALARDTTGTQVQTTTTLTTVPSSSPSSSTALPPSSHPPASTTSSTSTPASIFMDKSIPVDPEKEARSRAALREILNFMPKPKVKKEYPPIWPALSRITSHPYFSNFLTFVICLNTLQLAMPYYGMSDEYVHGLDVANYVFSAIFGIEMILKLIGDGPLRYVSDSFNIFDGFVVIVSFVDIALTALLGESGGGLSALRTFRLARVFKLARQWKDLAKLLATIIKSLKNVSSAVMVLGIILFIFTCLQMQLFGGLYQNAVDAGILDDKPRAHYDDFLTAFISTFVTTTGANWNDQLAKGNAAFGPTFVIVLIALQLVGSYIFFNLFLAILLGAFESEMEIEKLEQEKLEKAAKLITAKSSPSSSPSKTNDTLNDSTDSDNSKNGKTNNSFGNLASTLMSEIAVIENYDPENTTRTGSNEKNVSSAPLSFASKDEGSTNIVKEFTNPMDRSSATLSTVSRPIPVRSEGGSNNPTGTSNGGLPPLIILTASTNTTATAPESLIAPTVPSPSGVNLGTTESVFTPPQQQTSLLPSFIPSPSSVSSAPATGTLDLPLGSLGSMNNSDPNTNNSSLVNYGINNSLSNDSISPSLPPTQITTISPSSTPPERSTLSSVSNSRRSPLNPSPTNDHSTSSGSLTNTKLRSTTSSPALGTSTSPSKGTTEGQGQDAGDLQMVVKGGTTKSIVTRVKTENGKEVAVRVLASGDVQLDSGNKIEGNILDPIIAYKKLGVVTEVTPDGSCRPHVSLGVLSVSHPLRRLAAVLVAHPFFENLILLLILISSINLALDEPHIHVCKELPASDPDNCIPLALWLHWSDIIITALFVLEMTAKIIALGFVSHTGAYLRNPWNVLDFVIVLISVLSLALASLASKLRALRSLRALRALRPLRVVSRYPGLKLVVNAVIGALPKVKNVLLINFLFLLLLAIVGLQNFSGALNYCNDPSVVTKEDCVGDWILTEDACNLLPHDYYVDECLQSIEGVPFPRRWESIYQNFNDIFHAIQTVFEVATGDGWPDIMFPVTDAVGMDKPMQREYNMPATLYFVVIQVACGFFLLELFTGVIIANYYQLKEEAQGSGLLTEQQKLWVEQMKMMLSINASRSMKKPVNPNLTVRRIRLRIFAIVVSKPFEWFIMSLILLNTVALAVRHYGENDEWVLAGEGANDVFAAFFMMEAILKLSAFGLKQYFSVPWNRFDFALVLASVIGWAADVGPLATLFRIFRVARIIRLVRTSRGLLMLFRTLIVSVPALINVGIILLLILFIFSIVGMNLFAGIRYSQGSYGPDANFDSFFTSMLTLFRCSTGEDFTGIMHALQVQPPYCIPSDDETLGLTANCGDTVAPSIFFCLFATLSSFVIIKLLVAVVLDSFSDMMEAEEEQESFRLKPDILEAYTEAWGICDPSATKFVREGGLVRLVTMLDYPLGVRNSPHIGPGMSIRKAATSLLLSLDLPPSADGRYQFHAVLQELVKAASGGAAAPQARVHVAGDMKEAQYTLRETLAAIRVQGLYRTNRARRNLRKLLETQRANRAAGLPSVYSTNTNNAEKTKRNRSGSSHGSLRERVNSWWRTTSPASTAPAPSPIPSTTTSSTVITTTKSTDHPNAKFEIENPTNAAIPHHPSSNAAHHPSNAYRWGQRERHRQEMDKYLYGST